VLGYQGVYLIVRQAVRAGNLHKFLCGLLQLAFCLGPIEDVAHSGSVIIAQHGENFFKLPQCLLQRRNIAASNVAGVGRRIGLAYHLKQRA